jgi:hypothetical protein
VITRLILVCASLLAVAHVARADDLAPGLWELSLEAKVEADPGFQTGPLTVNQCVTKNETSDMSKVLAPITTAGASNCSFSEKSYVGDTFRFTMQCAGTLQLKTTGEVTFSATAMHGTITTSSTIDGKSVEFTSAISGHRLGDC